MSDSSPVKEARRYNSGKLRYELISTYGLKELAKVYTSGAEKYTIRDKDGKIIEDGSDNWRKGLPWMSVIASAQRHIEAFKEGEDFDELGTYHLANAAWNLFTILDYYKTHPGYDNRPINKLKKPRISLDVDDVCADFIGEWRKLYDLPEAESWQFDPLMGERLQRMRENGTLADFSLQLPELVNGQELLFDPVAYITARGEDSKAVTEEWLKLKKFPFAPVHCTNHGSKLQIIKDLNVDIHVDDNYQTFMELNSNGVCCYLFDAPHNRKWKVGHKRIHSLKELK